MNSKLAGAQTADNIREQFHSLLTRANRERPSAADIQALKNLLYDNKEMELWKAIVRMGELAESQALDTIVNGSGPGMRECWRQRLQAMRADLGYAESPALERLLIQQVTLCWLNLNLMEYRFTNVTKQSISFACGLYWEKRLTAAQKRFTRACETLTRIRKWSRNTPALQLLERWRVMRPLRRLCGWERQSGLPSGATFSRAFAEFAQSQLPERIHAAVIEKYEAARLVGHISRDATAIEARERAAKKVKKAEELPQPKSGRRKKARVNP